MAREIIERLVDDLDGGAAAETVVFALDGASYEIDLSKKNAAALRTALERFISASRRTGGPTTSRSRKPAPKASTAKPRSSATGAPAKVKTKAKPEATPKSAAKREYDVAGLRAWAATNGVDVPSRGRIPQGIIEQYKVELGR